MRVEIARDSSSATALSVCSVSLFADGKSHQLRDLGEHQELVEREQVWRLIAPGLADTVPPLLSLESLPNSLARQVMPLIGRDDVLAEIEPLVLNQPLVTLIGTGGVGVCVSV
ncbi:MAG: hypothetical protein WAL67_03835 [Candidatus Cybelea sp.]